MKHDWDYKSALHRVHVGPQARHGHQSCLKAMLKIQTPVRQGPLPLRVILGMKTPGLHRRWMNPGMELGRGALHSWSRHLLW